MTGVNPGQPPGINPLPVKERTNLNRFINSILSGLIVIFQTAIPGESLIFFNQRMISPAGIAAPVLPFRQHVGNLLGWNSLTAKVELCPVAEKGDQSRQNIINQQIMKRLSIMLVILLAMIISGQAQNKLKIGEIKNGKLAITNLEALNAYLLNSLENNGTLGKDYQVSTSAEGDRCLIHFPVSGNNSNVRSIGIMLVKIKNDFYIIENQPPYESAVPGGGGSIEITCTGQDCTICFPVIKWVPGEWFPNVYCDCRQGGGACNMTTKVIIKVDI